MGSVFRIGDSNRRGAMSLLSMSFVVQKLSEMHFFDFD